MAIVGDKNHPEMDAHLGAAGDKGILVEDMEAAARIPKVARLAVVAQTTFDVSIYKDIIAVLREKADILDISDTICRSTVDRQNEVRDLAKDHDTFIVIGGRDVLFPFGDFGTSLRFPSSGLDVRAVVAPCGFSAVSPKSPSCPVCLLAVVAFPGRPVSTRHAFRRPCGTTRPSDSCRPFIASSFRSWRLPEVSPWRPTGLPG